MKLLDYVILPLASALVIIGAHLTMTAGIVVSYPVLMFAMALLFWFVYRKRVRAEKDSATPSSPKKKRKKRP